MVGTTKTDTVPVQLTCLKTYLLKLVCPMVHLLV